ncbi:MAG TPA: HipA domain-containing protein [Ideonella sp.]|nr:HipA domain-containing protein [Ideonella sp.]
MRLDQLHLWFLGDPAKPRWVGELRLMAAGKGVSLTYAPAWLDSGFALSDDLPLVATEHLPRSKGVAAGAVDDARPDRWGERVIQFIDKPARLSLMEYLYYAGDDRFGALGVSTSAAEYQPRWNGPLPRLADAQALSEVVAKVAAKEAINEAEKRMLAAGGSFGGAKPKALIAIDGEQWVIKFFNNEPIDAPLIEHASMTLALAAGITVAETRVIALAGENALAVRRFDREAGRRIHCLSAGTALRALAAEGQAPDLGYPGLAQLLRRSGVSTDDAHRQDMRELFRRMVFNILIDNTDDHEKNHALRVVQPQRQGRLRLAPAYDVLPTNSGQGHQEFIVGEDGADSTLGNAMSQCALFGLPPREAAHEVAKVIAAVEGWQAHFAACGVSSADIESLAQRIDGDELRSQRQAFDAGGYQHPPKKPRRNPFR